MLWKDTSKTMAGYIRKGIFMAITRKCFSAKERAEQLRKCCETIMDNAESIAEGIDLMCGKKIIIDMPAQEVPTIQIEQIFISKKMLDCMN